MSLQSSDSSISSSSFSFSVSLVRSWTFWFLSDSTTVSWSTMSMFKSYQLHFTSIFPGPSEIVFSFLFNLVAMVQWDLFDFFSLSEFSVFGEILCLMFGPLSLALLTDLVARSLLSRCLRCVGPCCVFVFVMMVFR